MFKFITAALFMLVVFLAFPAEALAENRRPLGDMSFFGGISEGVRLPRTTEQILLDQRPARNQRGTTTLRYSEVVFLNGRAVRFDGTLEITTSGNVDMTQQAGEFTVTHRVAPSAATSAEININRNVTFRVTYRVEGSQVIFTYEAQRNNWSETITINGTSYVLDSAMSHYGVSIIEDRTPGVSYYRGDVSGRLVYVVNGGTDLVTRDVQGSFHGYRSPWSTTETHRLDAMVTADSWAMHYQIRPSITMNKVLQFMRNEPTAISFEGNYREVLQNTSGLRYDIFTMPGFAWDAPTSGTASIETPNVFEQLPAPDLTFLRGNAAEDDIRRLFSTQIFTGNPLFFRNPGQAISRGQFVTAVTRAIRLPTEQAGTRLARGRVQPDTSVFHDVPDTRPEFPYIMAAYRAGLAVGRANSMFYFDYPIDRQEALMIMVRALGLTQMGLNPTPVTPFADDALIAPWAKREVSVAHMIGLAVPDENGFLHPTRQISMGEAANILNELIEYMRVGLVSDYADQIVNIVR